ncbi:ABC transporter permease [Cellvibrio japonicus]|uniref:ABC transporter permease n=1 Tax=Cellvibrio japonicus TaxID=155077 RepID=UPI0011D0F96D|nr:iron ABC transporter permease [Cellvibrio japonicus]QEI13824.1 iron ABC transporter permease [Cellvibrio japonicus]QEI17398.1 iron ABC transporter permease [Cellvibrio japonicus]QEI20974.1 iron ABC transporter permease [Cellvibrio japonicus]
MRGAVYARLTTASIGWWLASLLPACLVLLPVLSLVGYALEGSGELWPHLRAYVLPQALSQTLGLLVGVGCLVIVLGTGSAWLVTAYQFPGRRLLSWALLLPLAVPSYIVAYVYLDILHPIGPLQTGLRELLGYSSPREFRLPDIRSLGGCILLLGLVLYPYVYLPARALFLMQAAGVLDAARTLGAGPGRSFFHIALPLVRPAVAVGASLALMEAINDIGAAELLGVRTLTVSVYATWVNRSSLPGAAQIALFMLVLVVSLMVLERWVRRHRQYAASARQSRHLTAHPVRGAGWLLVAAAWLLVGLGFVLPATHLLLSSVERISAMGVDASLLDKTVNTLLFAAIATLIAAVIAFVLAYSLRLARANPAMGLLVRIAGLGYAIPGTVLAIGLLGPLGWFDDWLDNRSQALLGVSAGLALSGTGAALVYAYVARFLAIGAGSLEAGFHKIPLSLDDAARSLGRGELARARLIHWPLSRPALTAAMLLIFVDCMKELPATLLLRPLNVDTLATHLYGEASRGSYESGAIAALLIVLAGVLPIILLSRYGSGAQAQPG